VHAPTRLEPAALDLVLESLLAKNPRAPIAAINAMGLLTPMPGSLPLTDQHLIQGHATLMELVVADDQSVVIETWSRTRHFGAGHASVRLISEPERLVTLTYVDAMESHGTYIGLFEMESSDELMAAFAEAPTLRPRVALVHKNEMAFILYADEATTQILGWSRDELVGHRSLEFIDPEDHGHAISNWMGMLRLQGAASRVRLRHKHRDGSWVWFEVTNHNLLSDPAHGYVLTEMVDVTEEMAAQEALRAREHLLRRITEALPLGIFQVDANRRIVYRNARLATILGNSGSATVDKQLASVLPSQRGVVKRALDAALLEGRDTQDLEIGLRRRGTPRSAALHGEGQSRRCTLIIRALTDEAGAVTGAVVCVADVTESVRMRAELEDRATLDVLTRCHNRASILELLEQTLSEQPRASRGTAAIFVDLDRFKEINDGLGHAAGDAVLVEAARCLRRSVRGFDVVGRLGGDEFLVVCTRVESPARAMQIAERIAEVLGAASIDLGAQTVTPTASIGLAWSNSPNTDADTLVAQADQAMYESKRRRLGRPVLFGDLTTAGQLPTNPQAA
jgi:diguanylate cyclase (GGDEF)-like protein/PAS domain S-box-containing protein